MSTTKKIYIHLLLVSVFIIVGCAVTNQYEAARSSNSISAYENYLIRFPSSKYSTSAKKELEILYEERDWKNTKNSNTISKFQDFISKYPQSKYKSQAENSISAIEEIQAWYKAKNLNTIYGYENYLSVYPNSKFAFDAKNLITKFKEERAWEETIRLGTSADYKKYVSDFPYGAHYNEATQKIREMELILPEWEKASKINSLIAYRKFLEKYPNSSYSSKARDKIIQLEYQEWSNTTQKNTIYAYQNYLSAFPGSQYTEEAKKRIIDLEVEAIFKGEHGILPPMSKTSYGSTYSSTTEVNVYNNTSYTLTVRYSGPESKMISLPPKQRASITLKNGKYREAASVNSSHVQNYAGNQSLDGGGYSEEFYIITQWE
jgi:outer membrane protein assembly factor BamD (BamD/ComL family)